MPRVATIGDGASKHVVRQRIRPSPGAGVVCVGFVVTEVGVAVIVRVQSAELSGVQRFVLRLIGDWGAGSERIGGIALLGCPLPRPRRRSTTTADLLIWTPYGCTLVVLADFGSVQHGVLDTPPGGRWQVGERAADLRTSSGAVNPLQRARRQRAELTTIFRRAGVPEQIDVLVVLIPKTGSRITWTRPTQEPGEEAIMARIGQSTDFTEYFAHPPGHTMCWRAADIARAFAALGVPLSVPDPEEAAAEGFVVTAGDTTGAPAPADSAADRLRKTGFPLFGTSRRPTAQPDISPAFPGRGVRAHTEQAEQVDTEVGMGPAGSHEEPAVPEAAAQVYSTDRASVSGGGADAPPGTSGTRPWVTSAGRPGSQEQPENSGETGSELLPGRTPGPPGNTAAVPSRQQADAAATSDRQSGAGSATDPAGEVASNNLPGRGPYESAPWSGATSTAERPLPVDRVSDHTPGSVGGVRDASARGEGSPVSAGRSRIGGETSRQGMTTGGPSERPATRTAGHGGRNSTRGAVGVRRGPTGIRQATGRRRDHGIAHSTGGPRRPDREQSAVGGLRAPGHRVPGTEAGPSGEKAGGSRGARYAAALGAAGAVLAVVAGTVFAASGFARFEVAEYGALCHNRGGTTVAAPYAVAGPSPVHLAGELSEITTFGPSAVWHPVDARSVQLVACVSEGRLGGLVRTCQYPPAPGHPVGRTLNLFAMAYRLSVYEARTGNRLAAIDLTGEQFAVDPAVTDADACRAATGAPEEGLPGRRHSRLSHRQVQHALAPFVTPATPHIRAAR